MSVAFRAAGKHKVSVFSLGGGLNAGANCLDFSLSIKSESLAFASCFAPSCRCLWVQQLVEKP